MEGEQNNVNMTGAGGNGSSTGTWAATVIILAVIILGALYFWTQRASDTDALGESGVEQNSSDEAAAIEADLEATDIESLDAELEFDNSETNAS